MDWIHGYCVNAPHTRYVLIYRGYCMMLSV
jgi:hypothetical protein